VTNALGYCNAYLIKAVKSFIIPYFIEYSAHFFDAEIFPAHNKWKVTEKGFKMAVMMNKDAMINSCKIILEK